MIKLKLFQLKFRIFLRKSILNKMLNFLLPNNKFVIIISQNLDKHIVIYHKIMHEVYHSKLPKANFN
ncbi:hypothetical protein CDLVIII_4111 [Clostridium sp. DL-VIII]|nr:hypothetical protein CDLVIII_4111 [Clostridium sp. DL-VIII]OOM72709.1 hypothetical protein CLOBL_48170 [Clostridium sp. BL-8]